MWGHEIKGAFHSPGLVLVDLKGGCGSTFCVVDFAPITAFLSVASPQLQEPEFGQNHGSGPNGALNSTIPSLVSRRPTPRGAKGRTITLKSGPAYLQDCTPLQGMQ